MDDQIEDLKAAIEKQVSKVGKIILDKATPQMAYHAFMNLKMLAMLPVETIIQDGNAEKILREVVEMAQNTQQLLEHDWSDIMNNVMSSLAEDKEYEKTMFDTINSLDFLLSRNKGSIQ